MEPLLPAAKRQSTLKRFLFLASSVIVYVYAVAMGMPLFNEYVHDRISQQHNLVVLKNNGSELSKCVVNTTTHEYRVQQEVQAESAQMLLYLKLSEFVPATVSSLYFGAFSDVHGRKTVFFLSSLGSFSKSIMFLFVVYLHLRLEFLYIGFVLEGCLGSLSNFLFTTFAYTADITEESGERTVYITAAETVIGVAAGVAVLLTGYQVQLTGYLPPIFVMVYLSVASTVIILFFLPNSRETVRVETRTVYGKFRTIFHIFFKDNVSRRRWKLLMCMCVFIFFIQAVLGNTTPEVLFLLSDPFCWTAEKIGLYQFGSTIGKGLGAIAIIQLLKHCLQREVIAIIGTISSAANYLMLALASHDWMVCLAPAIGICGSVVTPIVRAIMSQLGGPDEQGSIFAAIAVVESICMLTSALIFNNVYSATVSLMHGLVFLVMSVFSILAMFLLIVYTVNMRREAKKDSAVEREANSS